MICSKIILNFFLLILSYKEIEVSRRESSCSVSKLKILEETIFSNKEFVISIISSLGLFILVRSYS